MSYTVTIDSAAYDTESTPIFDQLAEAFAAKLAATPWEPGSVDFDLPPDIHSALNQVRRQAAWSAMATPTREWSILDATGSGQPEPAAGPPDPGSQINQE